MPDVTAAEIAQGLDGMRVVIRDWQSLSDNPDMAVGTIENPNAVAAALKQEIDSYPSFGPFFAPHNPSPLTCADCSGAPADVLVMLGRTNADRTPAPGYALLLHCRDCAGRCKVIAESGPADPLLQCEALANLADVDVPRLLAAVDAALGVVAEMEAHEDPLPSSALTEDRAWVRAEWASRLRERIALALVGEAADGG